MHKLIRNALGDAYRMELVTRNVATQVKAPPKAAQHRPNLTVDDARRPLAAIRGERLEALHVLALTTGLRRGELLGLRWEDVDLDSRQLHVRRALLRVDGSLRFVDPKTGTSQRVVVMPKLATLGHSEIGVTMNTYAHVLPQLRQDAADAIDALLDGGP